MQNPPPFSIRFLKNRIEKVIKMSKKKSKIMFKWGILSLNPMTCKFHSKIAPCPPFTMIEVGSAWVVFFSSFDAFPKGIAHFPRGSRFLIKKYFIIVNGGQGAIQTNPIGFKNRIPHLNIILDFFFDIFMTFFSTIFQKTY